MSAYILLADGTRFEGESCGAPVNAVGEVVFTTGMSGYQECMTDPSFHAQLLCFTAPMVGNYGVCERAMESERIHARAAIMREAVDRADAPGALTGWLSWLRDEGIAAITGVDTRALVKHIRERGSMLGGLFDGSLAEARARELIAAEPPMVGRDLARAVSVREPVVYAGAAGGPRIVALDTGIKRSIIEHFNSRGATLELLPCASTAAQVLQRGADALFLVPGPGDPATLGYLVETVRGLVGALPIFGICLGHQILSQAVGLETFKLPFGHRGANHPVKDLRSGRIAITSQNHGFAVIGELEQRLETDFGAAELTHINLYDGTIEGLALLDVAAACVQYHPEAGPGPHDSSGLFDEFLGAIDAA